MKSKNTRLQIFPVCCRLLFLALLSLNSSITCKAQSSQASLEAYQNYDFVPGDKIVFEDNFEGDEPGEFPAHWAIADGQATMNAVEGRNALLVTASGTRVRPLMKNLLYLTDTFTIEFDQLAKKGYGLQLFFYPNDKEARIHDGEIASIDLCSSNSWTRMYTQVVGERSQSVDLPAAVAGDNYLGKWHHIAVIFKNKVLKIYIDQYRVLSLPEFNVSPKSFAFRADGAPAAPIVIAAVRVANGGGMKTVNQKFTDAKIITHINFDIDKASIKAESMGTLNAITTILKNNPDLKFDIQGFTDNAGDPAHNLLLSQQRADAVKSQLVNMGVDASRLTGRGLGDTQPIADNATPEGKANNRRVEFITVK
jgi:outer membrane protein OmpA-like peptidoglycan-associated protein